jgi:hypothetical protein
MQVIGCPDSSLIGKSFTEIAIERNLEPVDCFVELLETYDTDLRWLSTGANDRLQPRLALMKHQHILPGFTDAGAHVRNLGFYDGAISLLKQAVQTKFMSPEKAISRVTGEAARWFRLDTGVLQQGAKADFILINPEHLSEPISEPVAINDPVLDGAMRMVKRGSDAIVEAVFINGRCAFKLGEATSILGKERLGEVLSQTLPSDILEKTRRRNRISESIGDHPFTDYWDIFLLKHQNPFNIALHVLGVVIFYGLLIAAFAMKNYWLLLLLPSSQIVGLIGHRFFERSYIDLQDAVFSIRASRSLNKMFFKLITGKYFEEIEEKKERLRGYQLAQAEWNKAGNDSSKQQNVA